MRSACMLTFATILLAVPTIARSQPPGKSDWRKELRCIQAQSRTNARRQIRHKPLDPLRIGKRRGYFMRHLLMLRVLAAFAFVLPISLVYAHALAAPQLVGECGATGPGVSQDCRAESSDEEPAPKTKKPKAKPRPKPKSKSKPRSKPKSIPKPSDDGQLAADAAKNPADSKQVEKTKGTDNPAPDDSVPDDMPLPEAQINRRWTYDTVIASINQLPPPLRQRLLAIANIKDQTRLAKLAIEDPDLNSRVTAVRVLADQKLLAKVAAEANHESVRWEAVQKINGDDQPSLLKLIELTKDPRVRGIATSRVKDLTLRKKLTADAQLAGGGIASDDHFKMRENSERDILLDFGKQSGERQQAISMSVSVNLLSQIALEDPSEDNSDRAASRLVELGKTGKEGINDALFERIVLRAKCISPRMTVLRAISNQAVLAKLAESPDEEVRSIVAVRIEDPKLIAKLAQDPHANVRFAAIDHLSDTKLLRNLAASDPDASVRRQAQQRFDALKGKTK